MVRPQQAFINVPYDRGYEGLYLAFIAALPQFRLTPRATLEIPLPARRLDRIFALLRSCRYSLHDLSRVQLDRKPPATPRFNMPFELGLAVAWAKTMARGHEWHVFEARDHRLHKSLSDLGGTDPHVHGGTPMGLFRALSNALVRLPRNPSLTEIQRIHMEIKKASIPIKREYGTLFAARPFKNLVYISSELSRLPLT